MAKLKVNFSGGASFADKRLIRKSASRAFKLFAFPFKGEVGVRFCTPGEIRALNRENRGKDSVTDVLSFPMCDFYHGSCDITDADKNPENGRVFLGDMVICLERARNQAKELGHGAARECAYLSVHSMLHLLGFDHEDEGEEKKIMRQKEEEILKSLGLERK